MIRVRYADVRRSKTFGDCSPLDLVEIYLLSSFPPVLPHPSTLTGAPLENLYTLPITLAFVQMPRIFHPLSDLSPLTSQIVTSSDGLQIFTESIGKIGAPVGKSPLLSLDFADGF